MKTSPAPRRRKYIRDPNFSRKLSITERDTEIFRHVHRHRLLNTNHIILLLGARNPTKIKDRLTLLFHGGYLDRLDERVGSTFQAGSYPAVYALDTQGAEHLQLQGHRVDWRAKNRALKPITYHHTLLISDIMSAFEATCRDCNSVRFISFDEMLADTAPEATANRKRPSTWTANAGIRDSVQAKHGLRSGITPDKIFGLHFIDSPKQNKTYFFLEADRGTMPVAPKTISSQSSSSILKKLVLYHATRRQELHQKLFGIQNFRVLFVTTSRIDRVQHMIEACAGLKEYARNFLFTNTEIFKANDPLSMQWANGEGKIIQLYKPRSTPSPIQTNALERSSS